MTRAHRSGIGFDVHRFSQDESKKLVLGGVLIEEGPGLDGHSDADVIVHAVVDALLGAARLGDIGERFPDTDPLWKGADSLTFLTTACDLVSDAGWVVENVDCSVVAETPRVAPYRQAMQERLESVLNAPANVKAGRAEGLGAIGRVEGIACWAVCSLVERPTS